MTCDVPNFNIKNACDSFLFLFDSQLSYTGYFIFTYSQTFFEGAQAKDILLGTFFEQKKLHD